MTTPGAAPPRLGRSPAAVAVGHTESQARARETLTALWGELDALGGGPVAFADAAHDEVLVRG